MGAMETMESKCSLAPEGR